MNQIEGKVTGVYVGLPADKTETTPLRIIFTEVGGVTGDRHRGLMRLTDLLDWRYREKTPIFNSSQIKVVSTEELDVIATNLGLAKIWPEWLGANVAIEGIPDLSLLPPTTRLVFPNSTILLTGPTPTTIGSGDIIHRQYGRIRATDLCNAARDKGGVSGIIERAGQIRLDDKVTLDLPPQRSYSYPGR